MSDWAVQLNNIVYGMLHTQQNVFQNYATAIWFGLSVIILSIWGIQTMYSGADFHSFIKTVMLIVTVKAMLDAYSAHVAWLPGGRTFPDFIIDGPKALASTLSYASMQQMSDTLDTVLANHESGSGWNIGAIIVYWIMWLLLEITQAVMWAITCFGLVAQAVCVLLGPVFIPMLLIKPFAFLFWGWIKSLLQYSFYPLVCACYTNVLSTFFSKELDKFFGADHTLGSMAGALGLAPYMIIIILSMLTVPSVVGALFTGGQATLGSVVQMAGWARLAAGKK